MQYQKLFLPGKISQRVQAFDYVEMMHRDGKVLLTGDRPWEALGTGWYSVHKEGQLYRVWYLAIFPNREATDTTTTDGNTVGNYRSAICYAESADGIHWTKPALNRFQTDEFPDNNIVLPGWGYYIDAPSVLVDQSSADPEQRYKMTLFAHEEGLEKSGIFRFVSANGIDWNRLEGVLPGQDAVSCWYDQQSRQYILFSKDRIDGRRSRLLQTSFDFQNWSEPIYMLDPDAADGKTMQFYNNYPFWLAGEQLSFLNCYDMTTQRAYLELIFGERGISWHRLPTKPILLYPGDGEDCPDVGGVYCGLQEPICEGEVMRYYYYATRDRHDANCNSEQNDPAKANSLCMATYPRDRLVGQLIEGEGWFETTAFCCPGGRLSINAISPNPFRVELRSAGYGAPIPGFTREECLPAQGNGREISVSWAEKVSLEELQGKYVRIRIYGTGGIFYHANFHPDEK